MSESSSSSNRESRPSSIVDESTEQETNQTHDNENSANPASRTDSTVHDTNSLPLTPITPPPPIRWSTIESDNASTVVGSSPALSLGGAEKITSKNERVLVKEETLGSKTLTSSSQVPPPTSVEVPKIAIKHGLWSTWPKLTPHLVSVAVTTAVVQLSFRKVYWMDLKPPNTEVTPGLTQGGALNFLQLAAKLHEYVSSQTLSMYIGIL